MNGSVYLAPSETCILPVFGSLLQSGDRREGIIDKYFINTSMTVVALTVFSTTSEIYGIVSNSSQKIVDKRFSFQISHQPLDRN